MATIRSESPCWYFDARLDINAEEIITNEPNNSTKLLNILYETAPPRRRGSVLPGPNSYLSVPSTTPVNTGLAAQIDLPAFDSGPNFHVNTTGELVAPAFVTFAAIKAGYSPADLIEEARAVKNPQVMVDVLHAAAACQHYGVEVTYVGLDGAGMTVADPRAINPPVIYVYERHAYVLGPEGSSPFTERRVKHHVLYPTGYGLISMNPDGDCVPHAFKRLYPRLPGPAQFRADIATRLLAWSTASGGGEAHDANLVYNELISYWKEDEKQTLANLKFQWNRIFSSNGSVNWYWASVYNAMDETTVLVNQGDHFTCYFKDLTTAGKFDMAYDGTKVIPGGEGLRTWVISSEKKYLLVNRHTRLFQAPHLLHAVRLIDKVVIPNIHAHIGVPGAGKTTTIVSSVGDGDLVLTGCRETAEETKANIKKVIKDKGGEEVIDVRTADSYLINKQTQHDVVWLDERYALHAGYIPLIATLTQCKIIHTFGDPQQIPCYSRVAGFHFLYNKIKDSTCTVTTVSKRIPVDVARIISPLYKSYGPKVTTKNPVQHSLAYKKILNYGDVTDVPGVQYMTWTQEDKKKLASITQFRNVITIGEAQGITRMDIALIRLNPKTLSLFGKQEQAIVALTRHRRTFTYYTVIDSASDIITRLLAKKQTLPLDNFKDAEPFPRSWLAAGGCARLVLTRPNICYRPGGPELKEFFLKGNAHMPHSAPRAFNFSYEQILTSPILHPDCPTPTFSSERDGPLIGLQTDYNTAFHVPGGYDERFHSHLVERGDLETTVPETRIKFFKERTHKILGNEQLNKFSKLRTLQPWPRPSTQRQLLLALQKRNCNTSRYTAPMDPHTNAMTSVEYAMDAFCQPNWRTTCAAFRKETTKISPEAIDDYLITAEPSKYRTIGEPHLAATAPDVPRVDPEDLTKYFMMFKREPKNRLSNDVIGEYQILQTVIHHAPKVNIVMSFFRVLFDRFQQILLPKVFVQLRKSVKELEAHLNEHVPPGTPGFENDFEKFDKSQLEECFESEMFFYDVLGLEQWLQALWALGLIKTEARNFILGILIYLIFQRKTGTVTTSLGNLIINMIATAIAYKLLETGFIAVYYVGDDSFLFILKLPDAVRATADLALYFNLLGKVIYGMGNYFCSSFMVHDGYKWLVYPDPYKKIERLSYPINLQERETLQDRWISFRDNCHNYSNALGCEELARQCALRYPGGQIRNACRGIATLLESFPAFCSTYHAGPSAKR